LGNRLDKIIGPYPFPSPHRLCTPSAIQNITPAKKKEISNAHGFRVFCLNLLNALCFKDEDTVFPNNLIVVTYVTE